MLGVGGAASVAKEEQRVTAGQSVGSNLDHLDQWARMAAHKASIGGGAVGKNPSDVTLHCLLHIPD